MLLKINKPVVSKKAMTNPTCSKCGGEMKYVAPGVSKAGKPYPGFYSCKVFTCGGTFNPPKNAPQQQNNQGGYVAPTQAPIVQPSVPQSVTDALQKIATHLNNIDQAIERNRWYSDEILKKLDPKWSSLSQDEVKLEDLPL
jgi:hypothetical protein